jgi:Outer membrane protein
MKKNMKRIIPVFVLMSISAGIEAQDILTLEQCHAYALKGNKNMLILQEKQQEAKQLKNIAADQFLPKVSANAVSLWSERSVSLLSGKQKHELENLGTTISNDLLEDLGNGPIITFLSQTNVVQNEINNINGYGQSIVDGLNVDTRNIYVGMIGVTQPIFMGGKILETYRIAQSYQDLAEYQYEKESRDLLVQVDEAYWRVISVENKFKLAKQYRELLEQLDKNVGEMVNVGVATQSDALQVKVKLNEACISYTKAENGLQLSKMALYQLCGLDLNSNYKLADSDSIPEIGESNCYFDMESVLEKRIEIKMLEQAEKMAKSGVKVAASGLMPNLVANGGYMLSNPNLYNGFSNSFDGMFYGTLMLNIPICHPEAIHAVKLAKSKEREVGFQIEEAKEMIELQVNQTCAKLREADKRYVQAQSNINQAEENLRLANESFAEGIISATDLLGAQTAWLSAQTEKIDAEIDVKLCCLYLKQVTGKAIDKTAKAY